MNIREYVGSIKKEDWVLNGSDTFFNNTSLENYSAYEVGKFKEQCIHRCGSGIIIYKKTGGEITRNYFSRINIEEATYYILNNLANNDDTTINIFKYHKRVTYNETDDQRYNSYLVLNDYMLKEIVNLCISSNKPSKLFSQIMKLLQSVSDDFNKMVDIVNTDRYKKALASKTKFRNKHITFIHGMYNDRLVAYKTYNEFLTDVILGNRVYPLAYKYKDKFIFVSHIITYMYRNLDIDYETVEKYSIKYIEMMWEYLTDIEYKSEVFYNPKVII